jgi:malate dehydrogenase (oxaloacetate-decarboxylating)(NADP+)
VWCEARTLPDDLFLEAARALASLVRDRDLDAACLYPSLRDIRKISLAIAVKVASKAYAMKLARRPRPRDLRKSIASFMYEP